MHILMTADTVGGVWIYARELVSGLIKRGHRVTLISLGKIPNAAQVRWMKDLPRLDFRPTTFQLEWMQDSQREIAASTEYLKKLVTEVQPDVLHLNQYCYGALNSEVPRVVVAHSDVVSWWTAVNNTALPESEWLSWYRHAVAEGLLAADIVVAPSRWMMQAVCTHYGQPARRQVIYNGRTSNFFDPHRKKTNCVLTVGRIWDDAKQAMLLLQRQQTVPVCLVGQQRHPDQKLAGTREVPDGNDIDFRGEQTEDELRDLYAESSTYAATSRYEPFGLAPVEAALSGCALAVNDIPVFHELWDDNAFYFRRNDPDALASVIDEFSRDEKLRSDYADRALKHAREKFDSARMISEYEQLYDTLLQSGAQA